MAKHLDAACRAKESGLFEGSGRELNGEGESTLRSAAGNRHRGQSGEIRFAGVAAALDCDDVQLRLFGKPDIDGQRRLGVALARADTVEAAVSKAKTAAAAVKVVL